MNLSDVLKLTTEQLKEQLDTRGLDTEGSKIVLQQRFLDALEANNLADKIEENNRLQGMIDAMRLELQNVVRQVGGNLDESLDGARVSVNGVGGKSPTSDSNSVSSKINVNPQKMNLAKLLQPFRGDGDCFKTFEAKIKLVIDTYDIDESVLKLMVVEKLEGRALEWFHSKPSHIRLTVTELLSGLKALFDTRINKLQLRKKFEKRQWKDNEDFYVYYQDKIILSNHLDIHDEELVDYIIDGMANSRLQSQARLQMFTRPTDLFNAFSKLTELDRNVSKSEHKKEKTSSDKQMQLKKKNILKRRYDVSIVVKLVTNLQIVKNQSDHLDRVFVAALRIIRCLVVRKIKM